MNLHDLREYLSGLPDDVCGEFVVVCTGTRTFRYEKSDEIGIERTYEVLDPDEAAESGFSIVDPDSAPETYLLPENQ